jgi:CheY-like chemotaxis protein
MVGFPYAVGEITAGETPSRDDEKPASEPDNSPYKRIRQTADLIQDRVRSALVPPGSSIGTLRFLIVDDERDAAESLAAVIELLGCSVRTCFSGHSALLDAGEFEPHVCLLDLSMPGMDGLELASRLREMFADKPLLLIAVTAFGDTETKALAVLSGFHHFIVKPVNVPSLIEAIAQLWNVVKEEGKDSSPPPA